MGFRKFNENSGWESVYDDTVYTVEALAADDDVAKLSAPLEKQLTGWDAIEKRRRTTRRARLKANARVRVMNIKLDRAIANFANDVLYVVKRDVKAPLYRRIFPDSPTGIIKMALEREIPATEEMLAVIADPDVPATLKKAVVPVGAYSAHRDRSFRRIVITHSAPS